MFVTPTHYSQTASPGESVTINIIATDEYNHETTAFMEIKVTLLFFIKKLNGDCICNYTG